MKLLFDENLSPRLAHLLADLCPGSQGVEALGLRNRPDSEIWAYAGREGFILVSKDTDFRQLSFLHGAPPKVIWLSVGNSGTQLIADLLRKQIALIQGFDESETEAMLVLQMTAPL